LANILACTGLAKIHLSASLEVGLHFIQPNLRELEDGACLGVKNIGKPCAGKPHARFDEGGQARACSLLYPELINLPDSERKIKKLHTRILMSSRWRAVHQHLKEIAMSNSTKPTPARLAKSNPITQEDVAKVQSRYAKTHDGKVPKGGWVARLQRVAQRNANATNDN